MGARKIRQRELFDDDTPVVRQPVLSEKMRDELRQLLTQWMCSLGDRMLQEEVGDE
jgi:hypothetical protein